MVILNLQDSYELKLEAIQKLQESIEAFGFKPEMGQEITFIIIENKLSDNKILTTDKDLGKREKLHEFLNQIPSNFKIIKKSENDAPMAWECSTNSLPPTELLKQLTEFKLGLDRSLGDFNANNSKNYEFHYSLNSLPKFDPSHLTGNLDTHTTISFNGNYSSGFEKLELHRKVGVMMLGGIKDNIILFAPEENMYERFTGVRSKFCPRNLSFEDTKTKYPPEISTVDPQMLEIKEGGHSILLRFSMANPDNIWLENRVPDACRPEDAILGTLFSAHNVFMMTKGTPGLYDTSDILKTAATESERLPNHISKALNNFNQSRINFVANLETAGMTKGNSELLFKHYFGREHINVPPKEYSSFSR